MRGYRERGTLVSGTCNMLRGWKSASCNGLAVLRGFAGDKAFSTGANRLSRPTAPIFSNQRLRPNLSIKFVQPRVVCTLGFVSTSSSISFALACQNGIRIWFTISEARMNYAPGPFRGLSHGVLEHDGVNDRPSGFSTGCGLRPVSEHRHFGASLHQYAATYSEAILDGFRSRR